MPQAFLRGAISPWRRFVACGMMAAFLGAIVLADAPRLHDALHKSLGDHVCAVTLMATGVCEHLTGSSPAVAPVAFCWAPLSFLSSLPSISLALEFSRLEHAPPVSA